MTRKSGLAFHVHHNRLAEWCYDYDERVAAIKDKSANEIATRLRLFRLLPDSVILPEDVEKADAEWEKTYAEWEKTYAECQKAYAEWQKADAEWQRALSRNSQFFENLHTELCGCKEWNGKEIVFPVE